MEGAVLPGEILDRKEEKVSPRLAHTRAKPIVNDCLSAQKRYRSTAVEDMMHGVIFVICATDPKLESYIESLMPLRKYFKDRGTHHHHYHYHYHHNCSLLARGRWTTTHSCRFR
jgi:hypothetical protein